MVLEEKSSLWQEGMSVDDWIRKLDNNIFSCTLQAKSGLQVGWGYRLSNLSLMTSWTSQNLPKHCHQLRMSVQISKTMGGISHLNHHSGSNQCCVCLHSSWKMAAALNCDQSVCSAAGHHAHCLQKCLLRAAWPSCHCLFQLLWCYFLLQIGFSSPPTGFFRKAGH